MGRAVINVVDCQGLPLEAGRQCGEACRESMRRAVALLLAQQNAGPDACGPSLRASSRGHGSMPKTGR